VNPFILIALGIKNSSKIYFPSKVDACNAPKDIRPPKKIGKKMSIITLSNIPEYSL
jgi:hypothetical protein